MNARHPGAETCRFVYTAAICLLSSLLLLIFDGWANTAQAEIEYRFERKWPQLEQPWYFNELSDIAFAADGSFFAADSRNHRIQHFHANGTFIGAFGRLGKGDGEFDFPESIAIDPNDGTLFVTDRNNHRVQHFSGNGVFIDQFAAYAVPSGLAVASDGALFVASQHEDNNHRIQKFVKRNGVFVPVTDWGPLDTGDIPSGYHYSITIAPDGLIWLANEQHRRLQVFDGNGNSVKEVGPLILKENGPNHLTSAAQCELDAEGGIKENLKNDCYEFAGPFDLAFNKDGSMWVTDLNSHLCLINAEGKLNKCLGGWGSKKGEFAYPKGMAIAQDGSVWVSDAYRIEIFDAEGQFLRELTSTGVDSGTLSRPVSISVKPDDSIWVLDGAEHGRIQIFDTDGHFVKAVGPFTSDNIVHPLNMAIAGNGTIYILENTSNNLAANPKNGISLLNILDTNGQLQRRVDGRYLLVEGQFIDGTRVTAVQVYNEQYQWIRDDFVVDGQTLRIDGSHVIIDNGGRLGRPMGVAVGGDGTVYVVDTANHRVQLFNGDGTRKLDASGNPIISFAKEAQFNSPKGITVDAGGRIWVVDIMPPPNVILPWPYEGSLRLRIFDTTGNLIKSVDNIGPCCSAGYYVQDFPNSLTLAPNGHVWMADSGSGGVQEFDAAGNFIRRFGSPGFTESQFSAPAGVAVDSKGKVYVADAFFNRIQIFKPVDNPDHSKAIIAAAGGTDNNELWTATELNANYAYRTLRSQGFNKDEVRYLSSNTQQDLDLNGKMDDISAVSSKANLQAAITDWTRQSDTDNLILYLIDHGGNGVFRLGNTETLPAAELDLWLDQLETAIPALKQITIIIDACESGSFIKPVSSGLATLAGPKRRIITSAQALQNAYFLTQGVVSFSNYFWTHIFHGNDLRAAFDHASEVMAAYQSPQADFNGNGIANEGEDLALLNNQYIGNGIGAKSSAPLIVNAQAAPAVFTANGGTAMIAADIADGDGIGDAYVIVRTPDFNPGAANNTITELPKIPLSYNSQANRFENNGYWDTNAQGEYRFNQGNYPFTKPGTYVLTLYAEDTNYNAADPKQITVTVDTGKKRRAVIVEGYGAGTALTASFKDNAKLAHDALIRQGYSEETIYYLSGSGLAGVDATPTANNLETALSQWGVGDTEDLTLYLIADRAQINNEPGVLLSAAEGVTLSQLKQWLDVRQNSAGFNQSTGLPYSGLITVIVDACYSGEILTTLNPEGQRRILISSTTPEGAAHFTNHTLLGGQTFSTELSFSRVFWQKIQHGANLRDAFSAAGNAVNLIAGVQIPQLDDNFNGLGNDAGGTKLEKDGDLARKLSLGYGIFAAEDQPRILDHTPSGDAASEQVNLFMDVASTGTISDAWAIITRPDYSPDCSAYDQLPKLHLTKDPSHPEHWTAGYTKLNVNGDYKITFYAIDQNAQQSQPATAVLKRSAAAEFTEGGAGAGLLEANNSIAQANFQLVNDSPQTHALETPDDQDWIGFYAQQGQTYTVEAKNVGADIDLGLQLYNSQGQQLKPSLPNSVIDAGQRGEREIFDWQAPANGFYVIKVSNRGHSTGLDNRYQLQVYVANAPQIGLIKGSITNACSGGALGGVQVSVPGSGARTESHSSGVYGLPLRADAGGSSYRIDFNAASYQAQTVSQTVLPNITTLVNINLTPVSGCSTPTPTPGAVLPPNTVVEGGSFNAPLQGNPEAPATLVNVSIGSNATLSNVTIGNGSVLDPEAVLKEGVRFTDNRLIPAGIDLTEALGSIPGSTPETPAAINLHQDIINQPGSSNLLQQLQNLDTLKTLPVTQDDQGLLSIEVGNQQFAIRPVHVAQATPGTLPGIKFSDQGTVQMITETGRVLTFISSVNDVQELQQKLADLSLNLGDTDPSNGNLEIIPNRPALPRQLPRSTADVSQQQLAHYRVRPALYSEPAANSLQPGIHLLPHAELPGMAIAWQVFEQAGQLLQQALYPMPQDWQALNDYLRQLGCQNIRLNPDGILQADFNQQRYRGLMNYPVYSGGLKGRLSLEAAGDMNQDGQDDFWVIYADGSRQQLFLLPVKPVPQSPD